MPVICLTAGLGWSWTDPAVAAAAPPSDASAPLPIQRPQATEGPASEDAAPAPDATGAAATPAPSTESPSADVPEPPAEGSETGPAAGPGPTSPTAAGGAAAPTDPAASREVPDPAAPADRGTATASTSSSEGIDPHLLGSNAEPAPTPKPVTTPVEDPDAVAAAADAALARAYAERYRPAHNPGRFNLEVRTLFANAGGKGKTGGRLGGVQVDLGQSWNRIGYALTVSGWGGRVFLPEKTNAEMNGMFGAGPTLTLGRLALLGRGYLDLRLGYDFFYGVVNRRSNASTVVAPSGTTAPVTVTQAQNLAPHGPRVQLQMGLLVDDQSRRYVHGFGVSAGWQALVGSFRGDLPFTNMLTLGLSYWMG